MPALAEGSLGLDAAGYSILLSFNGLGSLIGALFVATRIDLSSRRPVMIGGICFLGTGLVIAGKATTLFLASFGLVIAGGGFVAFLASTNSMVQLSVSDSVRGRIMSIWVLVFGASQPIGSYAAGWIAYRVGTAQTIVFEGIACFVAAGYALAVLRQHREP
jgi:predicted MFS family arabinose efflux permease